MDRADASDRYLLRASRIYDELSTVRENMRDTPVADQDIRWIAEALCNAYEDGQANRNPTAA